MKKSRLPCRDAPVTGGPHLRWAVERPPGYGPGLACRFESYRGYVTNISEKLIYDIATISAEEDIDIDFFMDDGELQAHINVSDLFWWACSDSEQITLEGLPVLRQAIADVRAIDPDGVSRYADVLYAARMREMRPQGAYLASYVRSYAKDAEGRSVTYMDMEEDNRATGQKGVRKLALDEAKTQAMKDLFLALPERPIDIGNPQSIDGEYLYEREKS